METGVPDARYWAIYRERLIFATLIQILMTGNTDMKLKMNWDAMGIATSVVCAIHCAVLPILATSLPVLGVDIVHNGVFEWGMIALALVVGSYALVHGFIKHHRSYIPMIIFATGFIFLVLKQFFPAYEIIFLVIAVTSIISAHYYNYVLCHRSKCSSPHHKH